MTQNVISTYGDMWLMKAALEKAGKADRRAVAEGLRTLDGGPSKHYPGGQLTFDEKGRRVRPALSRAMAVRRARHRISARSRTGSTVLAQETVTVSNPFRRFEGVSS